MRIIAGLKDACATAEAWVCDIWGVIHNGVAVYPQAVEACLAFRRDGGRIVLVSNAPRPSAGVVAQLDKLGVARESYDAVLTSGDVARDMLREWQDIPTLHIGPERDLGLFEDRHIPLTDAAGAERILCSGLFDDTTETPESYRAMLTDLAARRVPMLCANPDIKVDRGGSIIYCGGAVAGLYAELGGAVRYAGKPYPAIYAAALRLIADAAGRNVAPAAMWAIGDGILTDIPGGITAGMPTVYVASAIHHDGALSLAALATLFPDPAGRPTFAMDALAP